jgi:hypothetical protein
MLFKNYRTESREQYGQNTESGLLCADQLKLGAILRIADATEKMAKNYDDLIRDRDHYKSYYYQELTESAKLEKTIAGLRGYITRLKKRG